MEKRLAHADSLVIDELLLLGIGTLKSMIDHNLTSSTLRTGGKTCDQMGHPKSKLVDKWDYL